MSDAPPFDVAETDRLLTTTRSVRRRLDLDRPVDLAIVRACIEVASQAPTGGNSQGCRWVVVTDAGKRAEIARIYREAGLAWLRSALEAAADPQTRRVYESAVHLVDVLGEVPVHVICGFDHRVLPPGDVADGPDLYGSVIPAAWSFMLALRSRGLGTAWTTIHLAREREVAELLGIPEDVTQVVLFPVAHTAGTDFKPAARLPIAAVAHWNQWGSALPEDGSSTTE